MGLNSKADYGRMYVCQVSNTVHFVGMFGLEVNMASGLMGGRQEGNL